MVLQILIDSIRRRPDNIIRLLGRAAPAAATLSRCRLIELEPRPVVCHSLATVSDVAAANAVVSLIDRRCYRYRTGRPTRAACTTEIHQLPHRSTAATNDALPDPQVTPNEFRIHASLFLARFNISPPTLMDFSSMILRNFHD